MRALLVAEAGGQPQLGELPTPTATGGTVLVRVRAAALNPFDNAVASGMVAQMMPHAYPVVLGRDAAGVVEEVGPDVDHIAVGDEVVGHIRFAPPISAGTLAEYAVLTADTVFRKPAGLNFVTAAALPLAGAAAVALVDAIDPQPGETVLVNGATGGVGSFVVQLLAARGAQVIATGSADDAARLTGLGAAMVVDHKSGPVADQVRAELVDGVDALVELAAFAADASPLGAVRDGGRVASTTGNPDDEALAAAGLSGTTIMAMPLRELVEPLALQAEEGTLRVEVSSVLSLDQALDGLAAIAAGRARGKIVVAIDG
jgi:NADPH:quinone reductase-like Zn-dependent oxidoreductase